MQPMQPPGQYPGQGYPQQPQQPYPQQGYSQAYPPQGYPQASQQGARRNVGLIVAGLILLGIGALAFLVFAYNAYQYATVEDRFADLKGSAWVVDLIKESDMRRMMIFGPVATVFGLVGLVLTFLGLRKR